MDEELRKELLEECERLTEIINSEEIGSANWKLAYGKKQDILEKMLAFNRTKLEFDAKNDEYREEVRHNQEMESLEKDKQADHRRIEEDKNRANLELEKEKQKVTWQRVAFEIGKIAVPLALTIIHYNGAQKRVFDFEEHGRITSTAGRELHLPKIFWK